MTTTTKTNSRRNADLAMIHMAAKSLFGDTSKNGDGRDDYEAWLKRHTGKRSAGKLTTPERIAFVKHLRTEGLVNDRKTRGTGQTVAGEDRPTKAQWNKIGGLARDLNWDRGLADERLHGFVERTAKVDHAQFITRAQASKIITGLENWVRQKTEGKDGMS